MYLDNNLSHYVSLTYVEKCVWSIMIYHQNVESKDIYLMK